jgi:hypothetical protein
LYEGATCDDGLAPSEKMRSSHLPPLSPFSIFEIKYFLFLPINTLLFLPINAVRYYLFTSLIEKHRYNILLKRLD